MPEIKYDRSHHAGATPEARIAARGRNSGVGDRLHPDVVTQNREGWNVNIHNAAAHGKPTAHETGGTVRVPNESRVSGGADANFRGSGSDARRGWPHGGGDAA